MAELELNKIVSMIMENPELVEKIKAMGTAASAESAEKAEEVPRSEVVNNTPSIPPIHPKRYEVLRSLEGFLSEGRKKNLETIMTLAGVFDSIRRKEP